MFLETNTDKKLYQKNYEKRYVLCISVPSDGRSWNHSSEICSKFSYYVKVWNSAVVIGTRLFIADIRPSRSTRIATDDSRSLHLVLWPSCFLATVNNLSGKCGWHDSLLVYAVMYVTYMYGRFGRNCCLLHSHRTPYKLRHANIDASMVTQRDRQKFRKKIRLSSDIFPCLFLKSYLLSTW